MHDIEPYYRWRDYYIASEDADSPMCNHINSDSQYTHRIYDHYIHPQWDYFGSETLYLKILYVDYDMGYSIIEFIGEWNDAITNDIMHLKRKIIDQMIDKGIYKFILATENVLNFHGSDDCYYEEWLDDVREEGGWICLLNTQSHISMEMEQYLLQRHISFGAPFDDVIWRNKKPNLIFNSIESELGSTTKQLYY